jgi:hypothetical protein
MPVPIAQAAVILCEQPSSVEYRNGLFYITDPTLGITRAMRLPEMLVSFGEAAKALQNYHGLSTEADTIIQFPRAAH